MSYSMFNFGAMLESKQDLKRALKDTEILADVKEKIEAIFTPVATLVRLNETLLNGYFSTNQTLPTMTIGWFTVVITSKMNSKRKLIIKRLLLVFIGVKKVARLKNLLKVG